MQITNVNFALGGMNVQTWDPPIPSTPYYLWSWGRNYKGVLGLGDTTNRSSPVQVGSISDWLSLAAGKYHMTAIKTDNTLWSFGQNSSGQLGLGDSTDRSSPTQIGALTSWLNVSSGNQFILANQQ